jgi:hypothetical protein
MYDVSDHAKMRWVHRIDQAPDPEGSIIECWKSGVKLDGVWSVGHESRWCPKRGAIVARKRDVLVTVLSPDGFIERVSEMDFMHDVICDSCKTVRSHGLSCPNCGSIHIESCGGDEEC